MNTCEEACEGSKQTKKYWSEVDRDEKIERLREEIKKLQNNVKELNQYVSVLKSHEHCGRAVMMNIHDFNAKDPKSGMQINNSDKVYF